MSPDRLPELKRCDQRFTSRSFLGQFSCLALLQEVQMRRWKKMFTAVAITSLGVLSLYVYVNQRNAPQPTLATEDRIPKLKRLVAEQAEESAQAVPQYQAKTSARLDDLS